MSFGCTPLSPPRFSFFLTLPEIGACLIADDVEQIAHRQIDVDEVQAPRRQQRPRTIDQVTLDIAGSAAVLSGIATHREVDDLTIFDAACAQ